MCHGGDAITVIIPAAERTALEPCLEHAAAAAAHARSHRHDVSILVVDYNGAEATDWIEDAIPEVYCWSPRSSKPRERAVNAAMQSARSQLLSSAILLLEAPTLLPSDLLTDLHRTIHCESRLGLIRLRADHGTEAEATAVPERGVLPLAMRTKRPGVIELLREDPAAAVLLRGDMIERLGGLDPSHTTGLAVADLVRRAHLDGWTTAWHTAPGLQIDPAGTEPAPVGRRLRDELDLIACDPALTPGGVAVAARAWLSRHDRPSGWGAVAGALAALTPRLPRLLYRRRQHRAIALAQMLHEGRISPPRGWDGLRPCSIGWEART